MTKIKKQLVSKSVAKDVTYNGKNSKKYIIIHETANTSKGANANTHARLQANGNSRNASWHYQVDDKEIIQSFSDDTQCWHAGNKSYNQKSIGIEICVNNDGNFKKAVDNAVKLTKHLMDKYNIPASNVIQHNTASGKNCPRYLRSGEKGVTWSQFKAKLSGKTSSKPKPKKSISQMADEIIQGKHGSGHEARRQSLGISKKEYEKVREEVNKQLGTKSKKSSKNKKKANITADGKWGKDTTRALQKALGTPVDGIISNQPRNSVTTALYGGTVKFGSGGSNVIVSLQNKVGASADGKLGPATVRALQKHLGTPVDGKLSRPSTVVKEMQKKLNSGSF